MTYLQFLLVFLAPPIAVLLVTQPRPLAGVGGWRGWLSLPLVCLIAFAYTTPWDNYLVYRGVWGYGQERVLATIGYVPVEEYLFFLVQPILTGLFLYALLARWRPPETQATARARMGGAAVYLAATLAGVVLLASRWDPGLYLGLILAWAGPVLLGLWLYAGPYIWRQRRVFLVATLFPTVYLWVADRIAIGLGIWYISDAYSLNLDPLGLPIEEATFFLVTNLLVVQGVLLFLHGDRITLRRQHPVS
jgi:lycopene cyclase domain-containing protein